MYMSQKNAQHTVGAHEMLAIANTEIILIEAIEVEVILEEKEREED